MNAFEHLVWALGHSLWQATALGLALWATLALVPTDRPRLRYGLALGAMVLVVFGVCGTWSWLGRPAKTQPMPMTHTALTPSASPAANGAPPAAAGRAGFHEPAAQVRWNWAALAGVIWGAGVLVMLVRMTVGVTRAGRLAAAGRPVRMAALPELCARLGLRRVRAMVSELYRVPAVVGAWSPVVLMPAAVLAEMSPEQLRMILAHELAHIRRWDFLVNVVQQVVEALLFFNPALWWISRQVRVEREACCDAVAAEVSGNAELMARTLAAVAARLVEPQGLPMAALAVSGGRSGALLERVRRLTGAGGAVQFPLRTLALGLVVAAALLGAIGSTAELTVRAAEAVLSPAERVEKMAQLQKELGRGSVLNLQEDAPKAELAGLVRMADGGPLPKGLNVTAIVEYVGGVTSYTLDVDEAGRFSKQVRGLQAAVWVEAPGYAPAISEALRVEAGGKYPGVELVIRRGFDGKMQVLGRDGKPVAKAKVGLAYPVTAAAGAGSSAGSTTATTDEAGNITISHAAERPMQATIEAAGYEFESTAIQLTAGKVTTVTLRPAKPTTGIVIDAATRKPLAGATIAMIQRKGSSNQMWYPHPGTGDAPPPVLAVTDGAGRFVLDQLRADTTYTVWVAAPDHEAALMQAVCAGQENLEWALGPERPIELHIKADAGHMPRTVQVGNPLRLGDCSYDYSFNLPVVQKDGVGVATLRDPIAGVVRFHVGTRMVRVETDKVAGPVVMDLRQEAAASAPRTREVVLKFDWPADGAAPRGKVRLDYIKPEEPDCYFPAEVEVKDGEARLTVPVPTKVGYSQGALTGYWIDDKHELAVPEGAEPFVISVKADPAGAIHGTVLDENGKPFTEYFYVSLLTVKDAPEVTSGRRPSMLQPDNVNDQSGKYLMSPLPLGGVYRLMASSGKGRFAVSAPVELDAAHPIQEVNLKFAAGVTLAGKVVGPKGEPVTGVGVDLHFIVREVSAEEYGAAAQTDREGKYVFEHVDPGAGDYTLTIGPGQQTQGLQIKPLVPTGKPVDIAVKAGLTARGRIIDVETGKPMGNERVSLQPTADDAKRARFPWPITTVTNPQGEFEARGLEDLTYVVSVSNTYAADAKVLRDATGKVTGVTIDYPRNEPTVRGGDSTVVEIKRLRSPWR